MNNDMQFEFKAVKQYGLTINNINKKLPCGPAANIHIIIKFN